MHAYVHICVRVCACSVTLNADNSGGREGRGGLRLPTRAVPREDPGDLLVPGMVPTASQPHGVLCSAKLASRLALTLNVLTTKIKGTKTSHRGIEKTP